MTNPFPISDENLKTFLDAYNSWSLNDDKERSYPLKEREKSKELKNTLLNKDYLINTPNDELAKKFLNSLRRFERFPCFLLASQMNLQKAFGSPLRSSFSFDKNYQLPTHHSLGPGDDLTPLLPGVYTFSKATL